MHRRYYMCAFFFSVHVLMWVFGRQWGVLKTKYIIFTLAIRENRKIKTEVDGACKTRDIPDCHENFYSMQNTLNEWKDFVN